MPKNGFIWTEKLIIINFTLNEVSELCFAYF
jgi:hypothetical protein